MAKTDIKCSKCGSFEYRLVDAKSGEVVCNFCRNRWIEPAFKRLSETEKFLEEQAKQPRVTYDNTTETDKKLMDMFSGMAGGGLAGAFKGPLRTVIIVVGIIVVLIIVCLLANIVGVVRSFFG